MHEPHSGSTGYQPVPPGDPPGGMAEGSVTAVSHHSPNGIGTESATVPVTGCRAQAVITAPEGPEASVRNYQPTHSEIDLSVVPLGGSPNGTGGSPVPPRIQANADVNEPVLGQDSGLRVLISGASGFIGRRLAVRLKSEFPQLELTCLVKSNDDAFGERGTEVLISAGIEPEFTDLVTGEGLKHIGRADILFHLAANTHTWESDQRCNDVGTERLISTIPHLGPGSHVIFTSTVAVLDNRSDLREPLTSKSEVRAQPLSRYGLTKWRAEEFLKRKSRELGFRLTILRLSTVYGADPRPNTFFDVLKREVSKQSLLSRLNWPGLTSLIHVDDVVDCLIAAARLDPMDWAEVWARAEHLGLRQSSAAFPSAVPVHEQQATGTKV